LTCHYAICIIDIDLFFADAIIADIDIFIFIISLMIIITPLADTPLYTIIRHYAIDSYYSFHITPLPLRHY
jgi:hypothetical protein